MTEWKEAGRAGRSDDDALWARFRGAQDAFFAARNEASSERDAGQSENLKAKQALAAEAEALLPVQDLGAAKAALRSIQDRWEAIGHVPRADRDKVENRLRAVEQAVRSAEESRWRRTNPEAKARAEDTVEQLTRLDRQAGEGARGRPAHGGRARGQGRRGGAAGTTGLARAGPAVAAGVQRLSRGQLCLAEVTR